MGEVVSRRRMGGDGGRGGTGDVARARFAGGEGAVSTVLAEAGREMVCGIEGGSGRMGRPVREWTMAS